ncbi:unnamed protein product [Polarella glacialis]|uniref:Mei2-like C-terminal RNA recognition motif domain-containing protein n=1 Tax=Polarella glacialis TaxID=89957 RepID=A0A813FN49_POLGL|nr:unnamed protein product [Polarella glacialis]
MEELPLPHVTGGHGMVAVDRRNYTSIKIKRIDRSITMETLLGILDSLGMRTNYDYVYLPRHPRLSMNLGMAFINFVNHESAKHVVDSFGDPGFAARQSLGRSASTSISKTQGLAENLSHIVASIGLHIFSKPHGPRVFSDGVRVANWMAFVNEHVDLITLCTAREKVQSMAAACEEQFNSRLAASSARITTSANGYASSSSSTQLGSSASGSTDSERYDDIQQIWKQSPTNPVRGLPNMRHPASGCPAIEYPAWPMETAAALGPVAGGGYGGEADCRLSSCRLPQSSSEYTGNIQNLMEGGSGRVSMSQGGAWPQTNQRFFQGQVPVWPAPGGVPSAHLGQDCATFSFDMRPQGDGFDELASVGSEASFAPYYHVAALEGATVLLL